MAFTQIPIPDARYVGLTLREISDFIWRLSRESTKERIPFHLGVRVAAYVCGVSGDHPRRDRARRKVLKIALYAKRRIRFNTQVNRVDEALALAFYETYHPVWLFRRVGHRYRQVSRRRGGFSLSHEKRDATYAHLWHLVKAKRNLLHALVVCFWHYITHMATR